MKSFQPNQSSSTKSCPDCDATPSPVTTLIEHEQHNVIVPASAGLDRRQFLARSAILGTSALGVSNLLRAGDGANKQPESIVKLLYQSLNPHQRKQMCFAWDHQDRTRGLLRSRVSANWQITEPKIASPFYTADQQAMLLDIFTGLFQPEWVKKIKQQLKDDSGGKPWGAEQAIAIFGAPDSEKFELVMTGRHMTLRVDGNSAEHVALGGPIFHGHAPQDDEEPNHPGNVFWHQALSANKVFDMLDGKQRAQALVAKSPGESRVAFRAKDKIPGLPITEMSADQKKQVESTLRSLVEPYRQADQDEILACLKRQGGLEACRLSFYSDNDIGDDKVWDNWRLEGPSFVWYFRGSPHVHIWINVADDPSVKTNA